MESQESITSRRNPLIKRIKRLQQSAKFRSKENAYWAEGFQIVTSAIEFRDSVEILVCCEDLFSPNAGEEARDRGQATKVAVVDVSERVFRSLSQRNNPDGLGAICRTRWEDLAAVTVSDSSVLVAVEEISDPGNVGTILRTIDAVGAKGLILVGQTAQPYHPRAVRASRGAVFSVPVFRCPDLNGLFRWARAQKTQVIATSSKARQSFWEADYPTPSVLLFGNENRGLSKEDMARATQAIAVPMGGTGSSLNVAVAVSLVLYEMKRIGAV